jgi:hypothetical protein
MSANGTLQDITVGTRIKLSGLWVAATLCYAYADILAFYKPGVLNAAAAGKMGPLGDVTEGILGGVALFMSVPCIMVALSLLLRASVSRWLNIAVGAVYTLVIAITMATASWWYYQVFGVVEVALTGSAVWLAFRWPLAETSEVTSKDE